MKTRDLIKRGRYRLSKVIALSTYFSHLKFVVSFNLILGLAALAPVAHLEALEARPSYQVFILKPGQKQNGELTLLNTEGSDSKITPEVKKWFEAPANKGIKATDWLKMDTTPFKLKKDASRLIKFTIQVPKNAKGEIMGMLTFSSKAELTSMVSLRLSLAIYVAVDGTDKREGEVSAVSVVNSSSDTQVSYLFSNTGNVHLRPKGLMKIFNEKDELVMNVVYPQELPTQPGQKLPYSGRVPNYHLPPGKYTAQIQLQDADWNFEYPSQKKKFTFLPNGKLETR